MLPLKSSIEELERKNEDLNKAQKEPKKNHADAESKREAEEKNVTEARSLLRNWQSTIENNVTKQVRSFEKVREKKDGEIRTLQDESKILITQVGAAKQQLAVAERTQWTIGREESSYAKCAR